MGGEGGKGQEGAWVGGSRGLPAPGPPGIFGNERSLSSGGCAGVLVF